MKKRYVITAAVTAALMAAGAVGGTIAYFTSENKANMSIEAGVVRMSLEASNLKLYSLDVEQQNGQFQNGGLATLQEATVALEKMTPGDRVEFDLTLNNQSNVLAKYQLLYSFQNEQSGKEASQGDLDYATAKLSSGLVISMKDAQGQAAPAAMTNIGPGEEMPAYHVSVELPVEAGNEYQGAKSNVEFKLYGVQANMEVEAAVMSYSQLIDAIAADTSVELLGDIEIPATDSIVLPAGAHIIGNGHKIIAEGRSTAVNPFIFKLGGDNVVIEGIEVEASDASTYAVLVPFTHGFTLKDCEFHGADANGNTSAYLVYNYGQPRIAQNIVFDGVVVDGYWANLYGGNINLDDEHNIIVKNSMIMTEWYTLNTHCKDLIVEDSVIRGWTTFNNSGTAKFTNVTFSASEYGDVDSKLNYIRCYSPAEFTNCKFLENGDHEEGDGKGLLLEVINNTTAKLTNCKVARQNALSTFIDIVADDPTTFDFVTLKMHSTGSPNGAGIYVNDSELLTGENTPSLVW
ncbi:MAG: hypothetical protein J5511_01300 [Bacilli bacterium]|nr:hypothetical protein [Bacilli bacterium]